jgi:hypothetical protein
MTNSSLSPHLADAVIADRRRHADRRRAAPVLREVAPVAGERRLASILVLLRTARAS